MDEITPIKKSKLKGLVLAIINSALILFSIVNLILMWVFSLLPLNDIITFILFIKFFSSSYGCCIGAAILSIINLIRANKIFKIVSIANLLLDICLFICFKIFFGM